MGLELFLIAGALWLLDHQAAADSRLRTGWILAGAAVALGFLIIAESLLSWDEGLSRVLFPQAAEAGMVSIASTTIPCAVGIVMFGLALVCVDLQDSRWVRPAHVLAFLAAGIFFARLQTGSMPVLLRNTAGGALARRLLPVATLLPVGLRLVTLVGQRFYRYGQDSNRDAFVLLNMAILSSLAWAIAISLDQTEVQQ